MESELIMAEKNYCSICKKNRIFVRSESPTGFFVCTCCRYITEELKELKINENEKTGNKGLL